MVESVKRYRLGLFGHPVAHSQSPKIHTDFAAQFGIQLDYQLIDATAPELPRKFKAWMSSAHGCNITVPHKQNIMPLLDHYTERAHLAQAVNTVFWKQGELWGDNTDGDGLVLDLNNKGVELNGAQVLIIGAGGATQGIIPSLLKQNVELIYIKNRNREKANRLAAQFIGNKVSVAGLKNPYSFDLIIHATSMGHHGLTPELHELNFHDNTVAYDLSYGSAAEPFLSAAKINGAQKTFDGLGMLYGQAKLAFEVWFDKKPTINLP